MAFEPNVPQSNDPNWLGWSKPVSEPKADVSGAILGKTIGEGLKDAAEVGGDVAKEYSRAGAADILSTETGKIEDKQQSLLSGIQTPQSVPEDVEKAKSTADTLQSSKANGAISPTYYYGQLLKFAKDTRSTFPMYRGQIDKGIAEATGVAHTAEEYYNNVLKDLNSQLTQKDEFKKKIESEAFSILGAPMMSQNLMLWKAGKMTDGEIVGFMGNAQTQKFKQAQQLQDLELSSKIQADVKQKAVVVGSSISNNIASQAEQTAAHAMGLKDPKDIMDELSNPGRHTPQERQVLAEKYAKMEPYARNLIMQQLNTPPMDPDTGKPKLDERGRPYQSAWQRMGPEEGQKVVDAAVSRFKTGTQWIKDGEVGFLAHSVNMNKAMQQAVTDDAMRSEIGNTMMISKVFKDNAPEFMTMLAQNDLSKGLPPKITSVVSTLNQKSYLSKSEIEQASPGAKKTSAQQDIDLIKKQFGNSPVIFKQMIDDMANIDDPRIPDRMKAAKIQYMFGPDNHELLNTWTRETRMGAFAAITSEPVVKTAHDLDKKYPGTWTMFKGTATYMLNDYIGKETRDLAQEQYKSSDSRYDEARKEGFNPVKIEPPYKIRYISEGNVHRFQVVDKRPGAAGMIMGTTTVGTAEARLEKINAGLRRMVDISKAEGSDPDVYIFQTLKALGYDPGNAAASTFPEAMMEAVKSTWGKERDNMQKAKEKLNEMMKEKFRPQ